MSVIFTTSWDDGDILDLKLSRLLDHYGVKGTFYVPQKYRENPLSEDNIREIALRHEIGAHTLTHPDLHILRNEEKKKEICGSKEWLEKVINKEVEMFCYPFGSYNKETADIVKECGFNGARTTEAG
ncbi:MAG TPA: polysaccharide deacetylase family protein, partial [Candidatus Paceibacterota bacterium]|nr:polysaccharide deacetylase family protein [Candidatus Paceibacterota bacterium]